MMSDLSALDLSSSIEFDSLSLFALAAIVIIGLPHGAFDGAVALALGYGKTLKSMLVFVVSYLIISILVVLFWLAFPVLALLLFLAISAVHFGIGDSQSGFILQRAVQTLAHGGLVVVGVSLMHRPEVEPIFAHLVGGETFLLWAALSVAAYGLVVILMAYAVLAYWQPILRLRFGELAGLALAYYLLPPLAGFALYFCAVHSARHMRHLWDDLRESAYWGHRMLPLAVLFTVASWMAGAVTLWLMPAAEALDGAILRVVFIGLAALTVPHIILVDGLYRCLPLDPDNIADS
ncbi:MAG: Brp/Blh family beta-carotene 15,15'-dioxygenase, partial [Paracoccaceae bacterium]|nr:Brp/Blh family beta-carotene 15,15'-dioxygenase [Paracoccaceae bacterium]